MNRFLSLEQNQLYHVHRIHFDPIHCELISSVPFRESRGYGIDYLIFVHGKEKERRHSFLCRLNDRRLTMLLAIMDNHAWTKELIYFGARSNGRSIFFYQVVLLRLPIVPIHDIYSTYTFKSAVQVYQCNHHSSLQERGGESNTYTCTWFDLYTMGGLN